MINEKRARTHLMDLLAVEGPSGGEGKIVALLKKKLKAAGVKPAWMKVDDANKRIPFPYETGNLIVQLPGTCKGPRRMFSGHMDTVPLCKGVVPVKKGKRIVPKGNTALGGDNRTALGVIITMVEGLLAGKLPYPPTTLLFTVGEESGLWGARNVKAKDLGNPKWGFNFDGGDPNRLTIGAIGAHRWEVEISGIASHAGVHPEDGVSAILIASQAIADIKRAGYFGLVKKGRKRGSSNVGIIQGGEATNEVTASCYLKGESRSHDPEFLEEMSARIRGCFEKATDRFKNAAGKKGKLKFDLSRDYDAFKMPDDSPVVSFASACAKQMGLKPVLYVTNGGLDANFLNLKKIPTVSLGAGQHDIHTVKEYVDLPEYYTGCRLAVALATSV